MKAAETVRNGSVLAMEAVETQGKCGVLRPPVPPRRLAGQRHPVDGGVEQLDQHLEVLKQQWKVKER